MITINLYNKEGKYPRRVLYLLSKHARNSISQEEEQVFIDLTLTRLLTHLANTLYVLCLYGNYL